MTDDRSCSCGFTNGHREGCLEEALESADTGEFFFSEPFCPSLPVFYDVDAAYARYKELAEMSLERIARMPPEAKAAIVTEMHGLGLLSYYEATKILLQ